MSEIQPEQPFTVPDDISQLETPEQLEEQFETDEPFSEETAGQTFGRFNWMQLCHKAELLLTLDKLELTPLQVRQVFGAFTELQDDMIDFVEWGIDSEEDPIDHPLYPSLEEAIMDLDESIESRAVDESRDKGGKTFKRLFRGEQTILGFGEMENEDLLRSIRKARNNYGRSDES